MYERPQAKTVLERLNEPVRQIIVITGPRQVGKTTLVRKSLERNFSPSHYLYLELGEPTPQVFNPSTQYSSEDIIKSGVPPDAAWIVEQWEKARDATDELIQLFNQSGHYKDQQNQKFILVLDEIQKIPNWSETVKGLWDADRALERPMHVIILGSTPLLMQQGLSESLAGRYEQIRMTHWSFEEMSKTFDLSLQQYIYFGGYPGSVQMIHDNSRWKNYIRDSLIDPIIRNDILMMRRVDKPELLKNVFELGCHYSGQELSYNKMLGQLQDAGNTTTLAHYLGLLNDAGLMANVKKYAAMQHRRRSSSPKLNVFNTALMTATSVYSYEEAFADRTYWGRLVESAVGAHLLNSAIEHAPDYNVYYWRDGHNEIDFVLEKGNRIIAFEVKSSTKSGNKRGLEKFCRQFEPYRSYVVGEPGIPLDTFLLTDLDEWFSQL